MVERELVSYYSSFNQITGRAVQALYSDAGGGRIIVGKRKNVNGFTKEQVLKKIRDVYVPENTSIVISGDFDYDEAKKLIDELFDTWFSSPAQLIAVKELGLDSIAVIKKSSRIYYEYEGESLPINKIFGICKKRRGRSKYLLSVNVMVGKDQKIPAKIICVRNKKNKKDWIALICTTPNLSEEEIIQIYGKRWQIEVFFKTCKSYLQLVTECHSLSYDALTAHVAIVFT